MSSLLRLYIVEEMAYLCMTVCRDSNVKRHRKFPQSITCALSKSIICSLSHACFAKFEPIFFLFHGSGVFSFSCFQRSACFSYVIARAIFTWYLVNYTLFSSSVDSLCFIEGNSCCRVLRGLLQNLMLCFLRVLQRVSVIPLI